MQPMDGHFYTKDEETHSVFRCVLISLPFSVFIFLLSVLLLLLMMLMLISLLVLLLSLFFSLTLTAGPVLHCPSWPPLTWVLPSSKHTRQTGFPGVTQPAANLPEVPFHLSFFFHFHLYVPSCVMPPHGGCIPALCFARFMPGIFLQNRLNQNVFNLFRGGWCIASSLTSFCLFIAVKSIIPQPIVLRCYGRKKILLLLDRVNPISAWSDPLLGIYLFKTPDEWRLLHQLECKSELLRLLHDALWQKKIVGIHSMALRWSQ